MRTRRNQRGGNIESSTSQSMLNTPRHISSPKKINVLKRERSSVDVNENRTKRVRVKSNANVTSRNVGEKRKREDSQETKEQKEKERREKEERHRMKQDEKMQKLQDERREKQERNFMKEEEKMQKLREKEEKMKKLQDERKKEEENIRLYAEQDEVDDGIKDKKYLNARKVYQKSLGPYLRGKTIADASPLDNSYLLPNQINIDKSENVSDSSGAGTRKANVFYAKIRQTMRKYMNKYKEEYASASCTRTNDIKLKSQQEFVQSFMNNYTPFSGLVLWHGLGSGKTLSAIGISEKIIVDVIHRQSKNPAYKKTNIIICAPAMLESNFETELIKYEQAYKKRHLRSIPIENYYKMFSANGKLIMRTHNAAFGNSIKNSVVIIDESQLYIASVVKNYTKIENYNGRNPNAEPRKAPNNSLITNYEAMMNEPTCRVVCLSGTPIVSNVIEIAVLINLLAKCPPMFVFRNEDDTQNNQPKLSVFSFPELTRRYGVHEIYECIDFTKSELDLNKDEIKIVQNPTNFINKSNKETIYFKENKNMYDQAEFIAEIEKVFGPIIRTDNKSPVFNVSNFTKEHKLKKPTHYTKYNLSTDISGIPALARVSKRNAMMNKVDVFKKKCAGFVSFFGNIDTILPTTIVSPTAGLPTNPLQKVGVAFNGSPLFTVQRCEYNSTLQQVVEPKGNKTPQIKSLIQYHGLEFMSFMITASARFVYPFHNLNDLREIFSDVRIYLEERINDLFQNHMNIFKGNMSFIASSHELKYYIKYINLILRPKTAYDASGNVNVTTLDVSNEITRSLMRKEESIISRISDWCSPSDKDATRFRNDVRPIIESLIKTYFNNNTDGSADHMSRVNIIIAQNAYINIIKDILNRLKAYRACWYDPSVNNNHPPEIPFSNGKSRRNLVYFDDLTNRDVRFKSTDVMYLHGPTIDRTKMLSMCSPKLVYLDNIIKNAVVPNGYNKKIIIFSQFKQTSIPLIRLLFNPDEFEELKIKFVNKIQVDIENDLANANTAKKRRYMFITGSGGDDSSTTTDTLDLNMYESFLTHKNEGNTEKSHKQHLIDIFNGDISGKEYSPALKKINDYLTPTKENACDIVILNSAAAEGITLKEVRYVVLYHLPSDMSKIYQIIGRAVRNCTHSKLDPADRNVEPILLLNAFNDISQAALPKSLTDRPPITHEETQYNEMVNTSESFVPYLNALREASIDCKMNGLIEKSDGTLLYPGLSQNCFIK